MGTVYVDKLDPQSGTALEIGSSGDTITIPSGATITNSGTATGFAPVGISSSMTSGSGLAIDSAGHVTMPLQSAFNARSNANQTVATSDNTTVVLGTEVFDQNNDFSSNTFTAPVTGRYQLNGQVVATGIEDEYLYFRIVTSNRNYGGVHQVPSTSGAEYEMMSTSCLADMDAGDTAYLEVNSETDTSFELRDGECQFSGDLAY